MSDLDFDGEPSASFAEWRGAVKTAFNFIGRDLKRLNGVNTEQWATIEQIRGMLEKHRDRCDQISREKAAASEVERLRTELGLKASDGDLKTLEKEVNEKASDEDLGTLEKEVISQGKSQVKHGVTNMFYGLIGGGLFSLLLALMSALFNLLKKG